MDPRGTTIARGSGARLTPARVAALEPRIRAIADELVDAFAGRGRFDAAADFAFRIPTLTMCALLDLPVSSRERFLRWNLDTLAGSDFTSEAALHAYGEMEAYWRGLVAERRKQPGADLISTLLHARVAGAPLSDAEIGVLLAAPRAPRHHDEYVAHAIILLARQATGASALARGPARWPRALDELLRFISPCRAWRVRRPRSDLHGVRLGAGTRYCCSTARPTTTRRASRPERLVSTRRALALRLRQRHPPLPGLRRGAPRDPRVAGGAAGACTRLRGGRGGHRAQSAGADARDRARAGQLLEKQTGSVSGPRISEPTRHTGAPSAASCGSRCAMIGSASCISRAAATRPA